MCDAVKIISGRGHVSSFERRGPLARGAIILLSSWQWGGGGKLEGCSDRD